jgi:hypothetical protein
MRTTVVSNAFAYVGFSVLTRFLVGYLRRLGADADFGDLPLEISVDLVTGVVLAPVTADALQRALATLLANVRLHAGASSVVVHGDADQAQGMWGNNRTGRRPRLRHRDHPARLRTACTGGTGPGSAGSQRARALGARRRHDYHPAWTNGVPL